MKSDSTVWAWGWNEYGGLGDGTFTDRREPIQTYFLNNIIAIAAGWIHSLALRNVVGIVETASHPIPEVLHLAQNYPNPFNSSTSIRYVLPKNDFVRLAIYDISGQLLRSLLKGEECAGTHTVSWNGMDEQGSSVSSGIYFYCLETGNLKSTRKMLLLK